MTPGEPGAAQADALPCHIILLIAVLRIVLVLLIIFFVFLFLFAATFRFPTADAFTILVFMSECGDLLRRSDHCVAYAAVVTLCQPVPGTGRLLTAPLILCNIVFRDRLNSFLLD